MDLLERLTAPGAKRILALDGGGMRGMITLGFLKKIEDLLRERYRNPDYRLADYFDLICGNSTGAIIAGLLALGKGVDEIITTYEEVGKVIFGRKRAKLWRSMFHEKPLEGKISEMIGDTTIGSDEIRTGLCIITKRADTNSVWPLLNHPNGKFYNENKGILLGKIIRASAAAPLYFTPKQFEVEPGQTATFVDGGVSMANNPSLQSLLVATLSGFPFGWKKGADNLLMVSVGTGSYEFRVDALAMSRLKMWRWLSHVPRMLIQDASKQNELLMQALSNTATPWSIDLEVGDLSNDLLSIEPLLTYLRYNVLLDADYLEKLGLPELMSHAEQMRALDNSNEIANYKLLGKTAAEQQVHDDHFPAVFDPVGG